MTDPSFKFIHLTDPHIIASPNTLFGTNVHHHLRCAVDSINRNFSDAKLCMITGDLAHWGEAQAYAELKEILAELKVPWHLLMGNHDARVAARDTFPELPWSKDGFLHYRMDTAAGVFLVLDTVDDGNNNGRLCESRLRWLRQQLLDSQASRDDVFLFMHHPPMKIGIHSMDLIGMANPEDLIAVLQASAQRHDAAVVLNGQRAEICDDFFVPWLVGIEVILLWFVQKEDCNVDQETGYNQAASNGSKHIDG